MEKGSRAFFIALVVITSFTSCNDDDASTPAKSIAGKYNGIEEHSLYTPAGPSNNTEVKVLNISVGLSDTIIVSYDNSSNNSNQAKLVKQQPDTANGTIHYYYGVGVPYYGGNGHGTYLKYFPNSDSISVDFIIQLSGGVGDVYYFKGTRI